MIVIWQGMKHENSSVIEFCQFFMDDDKEDCVYPSTREAAISNDVDNVKKYESADQLNNYDLTTFFSTDPENPTKTITHYQP